jgi:hypothetical protein
LWTINVDNLIDDQIAMYNHDCRPHSQKGHELMVDECNKAKVFAENARWIVYGMVIYYWVTEFVGGLIELALTNLTYIGGTIVTGTIGYAVRRQLMPAWF